jgi:hypothetical protein
MYSTNPSGHQANAMQCNAMQCIATKENEMKATISKMH